MKKIFISNKEYEFLYPIKKRIDQYGYCAVLLDIPPKIIDNENVLLFDLESGKMLWKIEKSIVDKHKLCDDEPFVDVEFNFSQQLILWNWGGWKVTIDPKTDIELDYEFTK